MAKAAALAIGAHPDDIEILMAGTLLRLGEAGYELHYMNVANGCCGSTQYTRADASEIRKRESMEAADSLSAKYHPSICNDMEIFYEKQILAQIAAVIRSVQPTLILTHSPVDYMEDHSITCRLVVSAAFSRGMPNFPTSPPMPHYTNPVAIYHAQPYSNFDPLGNLVRPNLYVDTTDVIEKKITALSLHRSQKDWLDESQGIDSYLKTLRDLDAQVGEMSGKFSFAEGWRQHLHLGFSQKGFDPLSADLNLS